MSIDPEKFAREYLLGKNNVTLDELVEAYFKGINASQAEINGAKYGFKHLVSTGKLKLEDNIISLA